MWGGVPNIHHASLGTRLRVLLQGTNIVDVVLDSGLELDVQEEMLELLAKKRIQDARGGQAKAAARTEGEQIRKRFGAHEESIIQKFKNNKEAVQIAADLLLNKTPMTDIYRELRSRGFQAYGSLVRNAFGSPVALIKSVYPDMDENEIREKISVPLSRQSERRAALTKATEIFSVLNVKPIPPTPEAVRDFSRTLQTFIMTHRRKESNKEINPFVNIWQRFDEKDGFTTLNLRIEEDDAPEESVGWFNLLSEQLKIWVDTKGETDSCFDALALFNEPTQPFKCTISLRTPNYLLRSVFYQTTRDGRGMFEVSKK